VSDAGGKIEGMAYWSYGAIEYKNVGVRFRVSAKAPTANAIFLIKEVTPNILIQIEDVDLM
jgi:transposase-like protein